MTRMRVERRIEQWQTLYKGKSHAIYSYNIFAM